MQWLGHDKTSGEDFTVIALSFASYDAAANSTLWHNPEMKNYLYLNNDPTQFPEPKRWRAHVNGSKNVQLRLLLSQCWTRLQTDMDE